MLEDKFKFTRANIVLIVINSILVIFVILAAVQLIISLKNTEGEIPELKTTVGKSSTLYADATSTTTTESTTTTTKKKGNETSPYYDIDVYSILNKDLVEKKDLSKDEMIELCKGYFKIYEGLLVPSDDDFVNINHLLSKAKDGDKDKIKVDGRDYGIIYDGEKLFDSIFTTEVVNKLKSIKFDGIATLRYDYSNFAYYKLGGTTPKSYEVVTYEFQRNADSIKLKITYKDTDKKNAAYESGYVGIIYDTTEKKWKSNYVSFPNEDK